MSDQLSTDDVLSRVLRAPLVPVFYHPDLDYAKRILTACYAGGIRVFEFTNRGTDAFNVFSQLVVYARAHCPEMLMGIGTIYTADVAERFITAGADFIVQPFTTEDVAEACQRHEVPWIPGALTPTEIFRAHQLGAAIVKIFPGNAVGPDYIKAVRGPMPGIKLMVTGGVEPTVENLGQWFGAGVNVVGIGSQLFKNADDVNALSGRVAELMHFLQSSSR